MPRHASPSPSVLLLKGMDRCTHLHTRSSSFSLLIPRSSFSSEAAKLEGDPSVTVKELHDKILDSVNVKRSMPRNAWLWSLIESCQNQDDINLLFEVLHKLRRFVNKWDLLAKYSKKFSKDRVKLRKTTFDVSMDFAAKRGDTESLWKVDKLRSETYNQHTFLLLFLVQRLTHLCFYLVLLMFITFIAYTRRVSSLKVNLKKLLPSSSLSARHMVTEFKKLVNEWACGGYQAPS
ncbi:Uncharacterized protein Rs2_38243 [Raphanus sativus]|nr:Uncharacterized protein Rs2_38243 [Raphanus sativus]